MRNQLLTALLAASALVLLPTAAQAGTWLPSQAVPIGPGMNGDIAAGANGDATIIGDELSSPGPITAARHAPGAATFAALPNVSADPTAANKLSVDSTRFPGHALASNRAGARVAAWIVDGGPGSKKLMIAAAPPGGAFGAPQQVGAAGNFVFPDVTIDDNGDAAIVFLDGTNAEVITRDGATGAFTDLTTPHMLGTSGEPPSVAIDGAGNAIAVWDESSNLKASRRGLGGSWSSAQTISPPATDSYYSPAVAANASGKVYVAFVHSSPTAYTIVGLDGTTTTGLDGTSLMTLSPDGTTDGNVQSVVDDAGGVVAAWRLGDGSGSHYQVAVRPPGGSFPAPASVQQFPVVGATPSLFLAGNAAGDAALAWTDQSPVSATPQVAVKPAGQTTFGAPHALSPPAGLGSYGLLQRVALDERGDAIASWATVAVNPVPTLTGTAVAVYEADPGTIGSPSVPATAAVGQPVSMSVPLAGGWTTPTARWSFGDGAGGSGASVSHAFAAPGTYTVSVGGVDAAGATFATRTARIVVTAGHRPSNDFKIGKVKVARDGSISVSLIAPAPGSFTAKGKSRKLTFGTGRARAKAAGTVRLKVKPGKKAKRALRSGRTLRVSLAIRFSPTGGTPKVKTKSVRVKLKRRRH